MIFKIFNVWENSKTEEPFDLAQVQEQRHLLALHPHMHSTSVQSLAPGVTPEYRDKNKPREQSGIPHKNIKKNIFDIQKLYAVKFYIYRPL